MTKHIVQHLYSYELWGRVTHICVNKWCHHGSRCWFLAWSVPRNYLIQSWHISNCILGSHFNEISIIESHFHLRKIHLQMSSAKSRLCFLGLNVLTGVFRVRKFRLIIAFIYNCEQAMCCKIHMQYKFLSLVNVLSTLNFISVATHRNKVIRYHVEHYQYVNMAQQSATIKVLGLGIRLLFYRSCVSHWKKTIYFFA